MQRYKIYFGITKFLIFINFVLSSKTKKGNTIIVFPFIIHIIFRDLHM